MDTVAIGSYIREKRISKQWTQEKLAEEAETTPKTISTWENGKFQSFKNDSVDRLASALDITVAEIFLGQDLKEIDEETKISISIQIKELNARMDGLQDVTIRIEEKSNISNDIAVLALGFAYIAIAICFWTVFAHTALNLVLCLLIGIVGIVFIALSGKWGKRLLKRIKGRKAR